jgi:hypothetical protein
MTLQAYNNSGISACRKRYLVVLAPALFVVMGSLPALAGDNNAENDAGEGSFDHSGIYSVPLPPHRDFSGPSAGTSSGAKRYYYLQGRGWVPFNIRSGQSTRGN